MRKLIMLLGFISLLTGCSTFNHGDCGDWCFTSYKPLFHPCQVYYEHNCNSCGRYDNCNCTDPSCGTSNCLSMSDCCEAFGNVGAARFRPFDRCNFNECDFDNAFNCSFCSPSAVCNFPCKPLKPNYKGC